MVFVYMVMMVVIVFMAVLMVPEHKYIAPFHAQIHASANGQANLGFHMAKRQAF